MKLYVVSRIAFAEGNIEHSSIQFPTASKKAAIRFMKKQLIKFEAMDEAAIKEYFALKEESTSEIRIEEFNCEKADQTTIREPFEGEDIKRPDGYSKDIRGFDVYAFSQKGEVVTERYVVNEIEFEFVAEELQELLSSRELAEVYRIQDREYIKEDVREEIELNFSESPGMLASLNDEEKLEEIVEEAVIEVEENECYHKEYRGSIQNAIKRCFGGPKGYSYGRTLQTKEDAARYATDRLTMYFDVNDPAVATILNISTKIEAIAEAILKLNERYKTTNSYYWDEMNLIVENYVKLQKAEVE